LISLLKKKKEKVTSSGIKLKMTQIWSALLKELKN